MQREYDTGYKKIPEGYAIYANTIATAWRCRLIRSGRILRFIGFETDAILAEFFFNATYAKVRLKGYKEAKTLGYTGRRAGKYAEDFAIGAAFSVRQRMKTFDPTDTSTSALVSLKTEQVDQYVKDNLRVTRRRDTRQYNGAACDSGKEYGASMDIHAGISGSRNSALAIGM